MAQDGRLDHYKVYQVEPQPVNANIWTLGQFDNTWEQAFVYEYNRHLNPVEKNGEGILNQNAHLSWYDIQTDNEVAPITVWVQNQFGPQVLKLEKVVALLVPTEKIEQGSSFPDFLDHYKVYRVLPNNEEHFPVYLRDQWGEEENRAMEPLYFAVPVNKYHNGAFFPIQNPDEHLVFYRLEPQPWQVFHKVKDQFGAKEMFTYQSELLGVPTIKEGWQ
jgi:hypothetical protein